MNEVAIHHHGMNDLEMMARALASSKLFGIQTAEQALALCLIAQAEGRHPASAAQDYHIISGKPSKKSDAMLRDFLGNGGKVKWHVLTDTEADATFSHPDGGEVRITWDMSRATAAGVMSNAMWKKYPRQMLRARTVSEGVRTVYPMATSGMYVPEEVEDFGRPEPRNVTPKTVTTIKEAASTPIDGDPFADDTPAPEPSDFVRTCRQMLDQCADKAACDKWAADNAASIKEQPEADRALIRRALTERKKFVEGAG